MAMKKGGVTELDFLFGWTEQLWLTLDHYGIFLGLISSIIAILTTIAGILAYIYRYRIKNWWSINRFPRVGQKHSDNSWDCVVFTVSRDSTPIWMINEVCPRYIGIAGSNSSEDFRNSIDSISKYAKKQGIKVFPPVILNDVSNISEVKSKISNLIHKVRKNEDINSVAVDLSGGNKLMSLGAFMAAEENQATSVFVSMHFPKLGQPDYSSAKLVEVSSF